MAKSKFDWNNNGKKDLFDQYIDMKIMSNDSDDVEVDEIDEFDLETDEDDEDNELVIDDLECKEKKLDNENSTYDLEDDESEDEEIDEADNEEGLEEEEEPFVNIKSNEKIYSYCKVKIDVYGIKCDYLCDNFEVNINDRVMVNFGKDNRLFMGTVIAVGKCLESALAVFMDDMKSVLKVLSKSNYRDLSPKHDIVYEDDFIKVSFVKWRREKYLFGGNALAGTFLFENKYEKRFCIYFKNISVGGFLNQAETSSVALSEKQKEIKEMPFVYDNKIPEHLRGYSEIELKVCYGIIGDGLNASSLIKEPLITSDTIILKI